MTELGNAERMKDEKRDAVVSQIDTALGLATARNEGGARKAATPAL